MTVKSRLIASLKEKRERFFQGITLLTALPFLLHDSHRSGDGHSDRHDAHHDEEAYKAFEEKFNKEYLEHRKSAQQIKFAHSRAHEAAEDAIDHDYKKLVEEGEEGDTLRETYKTTLRNTLKKEIADRFGHIYGKLDPEADNPLVDQLYESLGVPKKEDLDKLIDTLDEYNPAEIEGELDRYQQTFMQQHFGNLPNKYAQKPADRAHLIKRLGLDKDIDTDYVTGEDLRNILVRHVLQGNVPRSALRKEIKKKKSKGASHGGQH